MAKRYDDDDDVDVSDIRKGGRDRADLRAIATYQKAILICILVYLCLVVGQFFVPADARPIVAIVGLVVVLIATVCVFLLSTKVYSVAVGILLAILTLIPCVGLIVLLVINGTATSTLRQNGIDVGFLGADMSQFRD